VLQVNSRERSSKDELHITKEVEMAKNSFVRMVIGAFLIVALILIAKSIGPKVGAFSEFYSIGFGDLRSLEAPEAGSVNQSFEIGGGNIGMGDLRFMEAQQFGTAAGSFESGTGYLGMGGLHLYEAQSEAAIAKYESSPSYSGMGGLHFIEARQVGASVGRLVSSTGYSGMGDLHLFESR
jgi:hypothetical protein